MVAAGEDDLICDFAQFYHIFGWRGLPLKLAATLAAGLPDEARCIRRASNATVKTDTLLLALIADAMKLFLWQFSKPDAPRPRSIAAFLTGQSETKPPARLRTFENGRAFDTELARFVSSEAGSAGIPSERK